VALGIVDEKEKQGGIFKGFSDQAKMHHLQKMVP